ncbi:MULTISPECIES: enoyl-CoA hydratase-related protein [unclassified Sphingobium]|uniref:enoyl-CoA hydratase-related protein n=1 Tax=unclassified Sphingobium TaxID=2611147 RepID=UPI0035A5AB8D
MTPELIRETPAEGVLLLSLNRPEKRNALATPLLVAIANALDEADRDDHIRAIVLSGNDKVFAAGADLDELAQSTGADTIENPRFLAWARIRACAKPMIAAVEGWCLGAGLELILRTDLVIAGSGARFGQPETNLGIMPGAGGTSILPRLVGRSLAMEMVLTGEPISADRALSAGLVARVVPDATALKSALELASKLASRAPRALRKAKASIIEAEDLALRDHLLGERVAFVGLLSSPEKEEGIAAFRERRSPHWQ